MLPIVVDGRYKVDLETESDLTLTLIPAIDPNCLLHSIGFAFSELHSPSTHMCTFSISCILLANPIVYCLKGPSDWELFGGLVVKALDCGVRGHRFKSHQLLPREGFSPRMFLLKCSLPTEEDLNISRWCFLSNPAPWGKMNIKKNNNKK